MTKVEGRTRRQLREARRRLKARLWVVEQAVSADQLLAATTEARTDPAALETWSERVDGMVDVYLQVRQRLGFGGWMVQRFHPARLAMQGSTRMEQARCRPRLKRLATRLSIGLCCPWAMRKHGTLGAHAYFTGHGPVRYYIPLRTP